MSETPMGAAMAKAGVRQDVCYLCQVTLLRKHSGDLEAATREWTTGLRQVARDMSHPAGGGQKPRETQLQVAPVGRDAVTARGGQGDPDAHRLSAPTDRAAGTNGKGQRAAETQSTSAQPSKGAGAGQSADVTQDGGARPERPRRPERPTAETRELRRKIEATIFDTFMITRRQGSIVPIGSIRVNELPALIREAEKRAWSGSRESEVLRQIRAWVERQGHVPKTAELRHVVSLEQVESFIAGAANAADFRNQVRIIEGRVTIEAPDAR